MNALSLIQTELSHAGIDQQLMERLSHLEERRITPDKELPPMEFLFRLFGKPCFPRGELVGLTGKPKSGKTFVSSILMTLCFRQEVLTILRESPEPLHVLWYDTEQSDESTQDILRNRILPMIGPPETIETLKLFETSTEGGLQVFNVRQDMWRERLPLLEAAIGRFKPDLVILDGIRDLINDINDGVLAQDTVERLMHLASEQHCCIACILHQNKSAEDKNLRGWIGTELTHKAFEVYECEKDSDRVFSFSQQLTRKYDILDTLKYVVDEDGIPQIASVEQLLENEQKQRQQQQQANGARPALNASYIIEWKDRSPVFDIPKVLADALPEEGVMYVAKDMQQKVMALTNITSVFFYNKLREQALNEGLIIKTANEFGHIAYYRPKVESEERRVKSEGSGAPEQLDLFEGITSPLTNNPSPDSTEDVPF